VVGERVDPKGYLHLDSPSSSNDVVKLWDHLGEHNRAQLSNLADSPAA
jgi:hypothetical protein